MRKASVPVSRATQLAIKPLALAVSSLLLAACSRTEPAVIIENVQDCLAKSDLTEQQCQANYEQALAEAERTAPRYHDKRSCEAEFGYDQCHSSSSGGFFMPMMMGYLLGSSMNNRHPATVYRYDRPYSDHHNKVMTADGTVLGNAGKSSYQVNKNTYKPKPTVTKTVSRGGFGSKASAKASWGGKSSGWGG